MPDAVFYLLVFAAITCFAMVQSYGDPPDEVNRFKVVSFICRHGRLPHGADPEVLLDGFGASYAFQPMLTYIIQGFLLRFLKLFTADGQVLLVAARMVNVLFGVLMAYFVRQTARLLWENTYLQWTFTVMTVFLPQNIFLHSYVNTDSMAMLAVSVICYGLLRARRSDYDRKDCVLLAAGIILCAMSYYNAYGYILSCILLFCAFFLSFSHSRRSVTARGPFFLSFSLGKAHFDYKNFLKKGAFISAIVLCGIAWWFIRSAVLYEGDFLGLQARSDCASLYAIPEFHPQTRVTWQSQGYSIWNMLKDSDFLTLSVLSFIGMYGPMTIVTSVWVYRFYKALFGLGILFCLALPRSAHRHGIKRQPGRRWLRIFFHMNMLFCILMPFLLSLIYSYSTDYQPQGRYLLPALLPLCFYTVQGLEKLCRLLLSFFPKLPRERTLTSVSVLLYVFIVGMLALTIYGYAFPYYDALL